MLEVGSLSFGSSVSASALSKTIFEINSTEDKNKISTPMVSGSGKNVVSFGSLVGRTSPKSSSEGCDAYSSTSVSTGFKLGSSKGGSEFETFLEIKTYHVSDE